MNHSRAYMRTMSTGRIAATAWFCTHVPMTTATKPVIVAKARIMAEDAL